MARGLAATLAIAATTLVLLELALRVYNPVEAVARTWAGRIRLPVNWTYEVTNTKGVAGLDATMVHRRNALGFRGPEWDEIPGEDCERWIFVGGSTTDSFYVETDETWVALIGRKAAPHLGCLWVNNAGLDGHSTFGHLELTRGVLAELRPDRVFYLAGINDVGNTAERPHDRRLTPDHAGHLLMNLDDWFKESTEIGHILELSSRALRSKRAGIGHGNVEFERIAVRDGIESGEELDALLAAHAPVVARYGERLERLIRLNRDAGMMPILITQPALFGGELASPQARSIHPDPLTGKDISGHARWLVLEAYNDAMRRVAAAAGVPLLDLARTLPKTKEVFYDWMHFHKKGQRAVADVLYEEMRLQDLLRPVRRGGPGA